MKPRLLDTFSAVAFLAVVIAAGWVVFATSAPASDQSPAVKASAVQAGGRNLIDIGTSEGAFLVTIRGGTITIETANILTLGPTVVVPPPVDPPPVVVVPPVVTDPAQAFAATLAKVTDPGKVETAGKINSMLTLLIDAAASGKLTDLDSAKKDLPTVLTLATIGKAGWTDFTALVKSQVEQATTIAAYTTVLKAASTELAKVK